MWGRTFLLWNTSLKKVNSFFPTCCKTPNGQEYLTAKFFKIPRLHRPSVGKIKAVPFLSVFNAKTLLYVGIAAWAVRGRVQAIIAGISLLLSPSPAPLAFNGRALPKGQPDIFKRKVPFWEALSNYPGHTHTHTHHFTKRWKYAPTWPRKQNDSHKFITHGCIHETPGAIRTRGITAEFKGREPKLITIALSKIGG